MAPLLRPTPGAHGRAALLAVGIALAVCPACAQQPSSLIPQLERLAQTGSAEALYHLGMSYQTGSGVPVDHGRALEYFRRAAAAGDLLAAYKLGCFHAGQDNVLPVDEDKALANKLVAARAGYALAQNDVAAMFTARGDAAAAESWLEKRRSRRDTRNRFSAMPAFTTARTGYPGTARSWSPISLSF